MTSQEHYATGHVRTGACRYEFDVRKRPGEPARVVINCHSPTGHCSRISVDEDDWPAFVSGFLQAVDEMSDRYDPLVASC